MLEVLKFVFLMGLETE